MTRETLVAKLKEIDRTNDFQRSYLDTKAGRLEETENVFKVARLQMQKIGRLNDEIIGAMETTIEDLYRCQDFDEVKKYAGIYNILVQHNAFVENGITGYN